MTEMSSVTVGTVKIRTACVPLLKDNLNRISVLYASRLIEKVEGLAKDGFTELEVYTTSYATDLLARVQRYVDDICREGCTTTTLHLHHQQQHQQQSLQQIGLLLTDSGGGGCGGFTGAGDDSSYDSDYENDTPPAPVGDKTGSGASPGCIGSAAVGHQQQLYHHDVSRTTSDTLAAEYADYVQTNETSETAVAAAAPGYTARVEFALKLGYTERLVQTALAKLGPAPAQNELLAELIKLGAQRSASGGGPGSASSDGSGSPIESLLGLDGTIDGTTNPLVSGFSAVQNSVTTLRPIVIDGSNVAMGHGNKEIFSCRGIKICVDYFRSRGHRDITVFVPKWRKEAPRPDNPVQDQDILAELERERLLVFTPSRLVGGKRTVCYDDRYILKLAAEVDGIVVSNDNYRDLCQENTEYRRVVDERVLMYTFVNDRFMPPDDPLGRAGPTLDNFLKLSGRNATTSDQIVTPPPCPYAKKCTYGNKCKYHHPERGPLPHKSVTERLSEHAQRHLQARDSIGGGPSSCTGGKIPLGRTRSVAPSTQLQQDNMIAGHATVSKSRSVDACVNLHRKLQRQLTLNPSLAQQPSYYVPYWDQPTKAQQRPSSTTSLQQHQSHLQHQLHQQQQQYLQHQHVTRIASAPDAPHQHHQQRVAPLWPPPSAAATSCSEPQLWPPPQPQQLSPTGSVASHREDTRRRMHYHLAAIFPEEQVTRAMRLYPEETNPQTICAAILSMQQQCRK